MQHPEHLALAHPKLQRLPYGRANSLAPDWQSSFPVSVSVLVPLRVDVAGGGMHAPLFPGGLLSECARGCSKHLHPSLRERGKQASSSGN